MIVLEIGREDLEPLFREVEEAAVLDHLYAMPYKNEPVYLCRGLNRPLEQLWPELKNWI